MGFHVSLRECKRSEEEPCLMSQAVLVFYRTPADLRAEVIAAADLPIGQSLPPNPKPLNFKP